jgi:3-hydroxybutyryl-CoA dehydratase/enoyl-CoA hydratase
MDAVRKPIIRSGAEAGAARCALDPVHRLVRISAADVHTFASLAHDFNPIHMDNAAAQAAGFTSRISHGALLTSIISGMIADAFPGAVWMEHDIQFKRPAPVGQTFEFVLSLDETIQKPTKTLGRIGVAVNDLAGNRVALSTNMVLLPQPAHNEGAPPVLHAA